jgi:hypothetical protein
LFILAKALSIDVTLVVSSIFGNALPFFAQLITERPIAHASEGADVLEMLLVDVVFAAGGGKADVLAIQNKALVSEAALAPGSILAALIRETPTHPQRYNSS